MDPECAKLVSTGTVWQPPPWDHGTMGPPLLIGFPVELHRTAGLVEKKTNYTKRSALVPHLPHHPVLVLPDAQ